MNNTNSTQKTKTSAYEKAVANIYSFLSTLLLCMTVIFVLFVCVFRLVSVDGDSMYPNLNNGDKIIVSDFLYTPDYGDIIAISKREAGTESMIKRVIALPGDTVMIDFDTHLISVNGKVIHESYSVTEPISEAGDFIYPLTVPEDSVFVLGDNRNNSLDSRYEEVGFIKLDEIGGKAIARILPAGSFRIN